MPSKYITLTNQDGNAVSFHYQKVVLVEEIDPKTVAHRARTSIHLDAPVYPIYVMEPMAKVLEILNERDPIHPQQYR